MVKIEMTPEELLLFLNAIRSLIVHAEKANSVFLNEKIDIAEGLHQKMFKTELIDHLSDDELSDLKEFADFHFGDDPPTPLAKEEKKE